MRINPVQTVSLYFEDGTAISARPFFYQAAGRDGLSVYFLTEDGDPVRQADDGQGVYTLGDTGRRLFLERPQPIPSP